MSKTFYVNSSGEILGSVDHGEAPAQPDYQGFYQALLASSVYQAVLAQPATAELARALAVFVSAIQDCMASRENRQAMQGAIWMLLSQVALSQESAAELQELMRLYSLEGVYVLQPS
jgi:hypothetical protein